MFFHVGNRLGVGVGGADGCYQRDGVTNRAGADADFVSRRAFAGRTVDNQLNRAVDHAVDDVGAAFGNFLNQLAFNSPRLQQVGGAAGGDNLESHVDKLPGDVLQMRFVVVFNGNEHSALGRDFAAGAHLGLGKRGGEGMVDAHDLAGRFHFGTENGVDAREPVEREDGFLHANVRELREFQAVEFFERIAHHDLGRNVRQFDACYFGDERDGSAGARVDFQNVNGAVVFDSILNVHQALDVEFQRHAAGGVFEFFDNFRGERLRRNRAGRVSRVNACLFDVFHNAGDVNVGTVTDAVDVNFNGV